MIANKKKSKTGYNNGRSGKGWVAAIIVTGLFMLLSAQETQEKEVKKESSHQDLQPIAREYVEVSNAEVVVRAFRNGKPVSGLNESDFTLYENGTKKKVASFLEVRRKIGMAPQGENTSEADTTSTAKKTPPLKRLFFFYLRISGSGTGYRELLDTFFKDIYRPGDVVLLNVQSKVFKITNKEEADRTLPVVMKKLVSLAEFAKLEHQRRVMEAQKIFKTFEEEIRQMETRHMTTRQRYADGLAEEKPKGEFQGYSPEELFARDLEVAYRQLWGEYRFRNIHMDTGKLKAIAASLKRVKMQKWGIVYYQTDRFPQFNPESLVTDSHYSMTQVKVLENLLQRLREDMSKPLIAADIFDEVRQAFVDANATFHLLLSEPPVKETPVQTQHIRVARIHSDWEQAFNNISSATGGEVVENKSPAESLARFAESEDIYYRLTYAPDKDGGFTRKINIKTADKSLVLQFNSTVTLEAANELAIEGFSFQHPSLSFTIKNYRTLFDGSQLAGDVDVKITVIDEEGTSSTVSKNFTPEEESTTITMKLNFPHGGKYSLIVESVDKNTGKKALFSQKVTVPRQEGEIDLSQPVLITPVHDASGYTGGADLEHILASAGKYCNKLKKASFYFTCKEEIIDSCTMKGKQVKHDTYLLEYQILMDKSGKMKETRSLLKDSTKEAGDTAGRKKKRKSGKQKHNQEDENDELVITNFYSNYPFLLPVTLLGREHQKRYEYKLLAKEQVGNRTAFKINVEPLTTQESPKKERPINIGVVWVDEEDGSILKIQLDPRALRGIDILRKAARRKGTYLKVTDLHYYDVKRAGIRFPSGTEIRETYLSAQKTGDAADSLVPVEEVKTVFLYKNYRFFNVNVNVVDSGYDE